MPSVKIRVGASMDRSVDTVFAQIEKRAQRAQKAVSRTLGGSGAGGVGGGGMGGVGGTGRGGPYRSLPNDASKALKKTEDILVRSLKKQGRAMKQHAQEAEREMRRVEKAQERAAKQAERTAAREARAADRANNQRARATFRARERLATRVSGTTMRNLSTAGRIAGGVARDIAAGAGVDFSLTNAIGRGVDLQRRAVLLSGAGYQAQGTGAAAVRQDPAVLAKEARDISLRSKGLVSAGDVMGAREVFVQKTGDLETARQISEPLAALSSAYGADLQDVADAAGDISSQLGDIPDKGAAIVRILKTITGQGKLGAVEMKDLASQMAKVASNASAFEGDRATTILKLGALAQMARARGGAASASQAATAVAGLGNTLKTPARVKKFKAEGIDVFNDQGQMRDVQQIITESITQTGGDPVRLKKMWANVIGAKPVEALANIYRSAGGGESGERAMAQEWEQFLSKATVSNKEIEENLAQLQKTDAAKAKAFQENLDLVAQSLAGKVLPALEKLAPKALELAQDLADLSGWVADNPGKAIVAVIVGSIAQAGVGAAIRAAIEKVILESALKKVAGAPTGATGTAVGGTGVGGTLATLAAVGGLGLAADQANKLQKQTGMRNSLLQVVPGFGSGSFSTEGLMDDLTSFDVYRRAGKIGGELGMKASDSELRSTMGRSGSLATSHAGEQAGGPVQQSLRELGAKAAAQDSALKGIDAKLGGTLRVEVTNPDDLKNGPGVNQEGRDGPKVLRPPG